MKIVFLFLFALSYSFCFYAQSSLQRKTKTIKVYENGKQTLYDSSNIEGKTMFFTLNQGYGSLVMNSAFQLVVIPIWVFLLANWNTSMNEFTIILTHQ